MAGNIVEGKEEEEELSDRSLPLLALTLNMELHFRHRTDKTHLKILLGTTLGIRLGT